MAAYSICCLGLVAPRHLGEAAFALQPLEHEARHVPAEGRRRIEHRAGIGHGAVVEDRRRAGARAAQQVIAHDHDRDSRRTDVLLRARVDEPEARHVERARQDAGGHVRDERHRSPFRERTETRRRRWSRSACSAGTPRRAMAAATPAPARSCIARPTSSAAIATDTKRRASRIVRSDQWPVLT